MGRTKHQEFQKPKGKTKGQVKAEGFFTKDNQPETLAAPKAKSAELAGSDTSHGSQFPRRIKPPTRAQKVAEIAEREGRPTPAKTATTSIKPTPKAPKAKKEPTVRPANIGGKTVLKNGRLSARDLTCLCGCGAATQTRDARFISGHDATLRKHLLEGGKAPAIILPFFEAGEVIAGVAFEGDEFVDMKPTVGNGGTKAKAGTKAKTKKVAAKGKTHEEEAEDEDLDDEEDEDEEDED